MAILSAKTISWGLSALSVVFGAGFTLAPRRMLGTYADTFAHLKTPIAEASTVLWIRMYGALVLAMGFAYVVANARNNWDTIQTYLRLDRLTSMAGLLSMLLFVLPNAEVLKVNKPAIWGQVCFVFEFTRSIVCLLLFWLLVRLVCKQVAFFGLSMLAATSALAMRAESSPVIGQNEPRPEKARRS